MMDYEIVYTEQAQNDLDTLYDYLSATLTSEVADRVRLRVLDEIDTLATLPERTAPCQEEPWHSDGWRKFFAAKHYTVFLTVDKPSARVYIARVFFSGMDIDAALTNPSL